MSTGLPDAAIGTRPTWTLSDRLRKAREDAGLDQEQLASASGLSRATISAAENGHRVPSRASLAMWALATGVSRSWLAGDPPPEEAAEDVRLRALLTIISSAGREDHPGQEAARAVLDAVAAREKTIAPAQWTSSSSIDHPEVLEWCMTFRPDIAAALAKIQPSD